MRKLGDAAVPQAECWLNVALSLRRCYIFYRENVSTVCSNSAHSSNTLPGFEDQNASWNRNRNIDFLLTFSDFIVEVEREGGDYYYSELSFLKNKEGPEHTSYCVCLSVRLHFLRSPDGGFFGLWRHTFVPHSPKTLIRVFARVIF